MSRPYTEHLYERIGDPDEAGGYLAACLEDGDPRTIILALRDIAEAHGLPILIFEVVRSNEPQRGH